MLRCAVDAGPLPPQYRLILKAVLNVDGELDDNLTARRRWIGTVQGIALSTLERREPEAFDELASILAVAEQSHCRERNKGPFRSYDALERFVASMTTDTVVIELPIADVVREIVRHALAVETDAQRAQVLEEIVSTLPSSADQLARELRLRRPTPYQLYFWFWSGVSDYLLDDRTVQSSALIPSREFFLHANGGPSPAALSERVRHGPDKLDRMIREFQSIEYAERLARTVEAISDGLIRIAQNNLWQDVWPQAPNSVEMTPSR